MVDDIIHSIHPLSQQNIAKIKALIEYQSIPKGEVFIKLNQINRSEYFLIEGICKSFLHNPDGEEITISFFDDNSVLSPYTTRTSGERSILNFKALTDIELGVLKAEDFEALMIENLEIRSFGNQTLRNELMHKIQKETGLATLTAKQRLINFRQRFPLLENMIPHTDIATFLGITNISLSRLRKELI
ncbi:Crp/Fnr family transcriptional regulator [Saccharicrinis sp. FJH62]|uniref:Crp/Fnr family transcriptional regulator n=1 Tax=Saccharicrinis sp. FJH62 TaxID=3344657 RepID=UPI0035D4C6C9